MARKKSGINNRVIAGVIGAVVILIVVIPVLFVVLDLDTSDIVPQSDGELQIPVIPIEKPIVLPEDIIENDDVGITNNIPEVTPEQEEMIDEILNMTETSTDPPLQQVCDLLNLFCGTAKIVDLEANIVKIDSLGNRFNETITFDVPLASLFVEETTDIDFRTGIIELDLDLITDPNTMVNAQGLFNINIGNTEILPDILLSSSGMTDENGRISLDFASVRSNLFTFQFDVHFNLFNDEQITNLSYIIKSLSVDTGSNRTNGLTNQEIFSMDIFRDDIQIFIIDTQGNQVRSYPQDDRFTVTSVARTQGASLTCTDPTCPSCPTLAGRSLGGCNLGSAVIASHPAPTITDVKLFEADGTIINAGAGVGLVLDELIFRNANYSLTSPYGDFGFMTPKSQKNYAYSCFLDQEVDYSRVTGSITNTIRPRSWDYYAPFVTGSTFVVCNFP